jgi:hypothetical protein
MPRLFPALMLVAVLLPAGLSAQDSTKPAPKLKRHPDLISNQEIEAAPLSATTAHNLVQHLRPNWLRGRGPSSIMLETAGVQVYVSGMHQGGASALEQVARNSIKEIQHMRGTDAVQRYGTGHENGAILVILK